MFGDAYRDLATDKVEQALLELESQGKARRAGVNAKGEPLWELVH